MGLAAGAATGRGTGAVLRLYDPSRAIKTEVTLSDVVRTSVKTGPDPITGRTVLYLQLTNAGVTKFNRLTRLLAERGARLGTVQRVAFAVNGHIYARPFIDYMQFPHGLDGRSGIQINPVTRQTASRLAAEIRYG